MGYDSIAPHNYSQLRGNTKNEIYKHLLQIKFQGNMGRRKMPRDCPLFRSRIFVGSKFQSISEFVLHRDTREPGATMDSDGREADQWDLLGLMETDGEESAGRLLLSVGVPARPRW